MGMQLGPHNLPSSGPVYMDAVFPTDPDSPVSRLGYVIRNTPEWKGLTSDMQAPIAQDWQDLVVAASVLDPRHLSGDVGPHGLMGYFGLGREDPNFWNVVGNRFGEASVWSSDYIKNLQIKAANRILDKYPDYAYLFTNKSKDVHAPSVASSLDSLKQVSRRVSSPRASGGGGSRTSATVLNKPASARPGGTRAGAVTSLDDTFQKTLLGG